MVRDFKLLVPESPGQQLKELISNVTAHNKTARCGRPGCFPCGSRVEGSKGSCWKVSPVYKIECVPCSKEGKVTKYLGESGFSAHSRGPCTDSILELRMTDLSCGNTLPASMARLGEKVSTAKITSQ